ncbi:alkaline phosphatase [Psychromarinibacter sp. C21-152]|uniref:Alkaline phosphatase n=1 Tax=Psychromarinibacter sediminicola TaxID=3033385 RepID=A0AAE3T8L2_9RHOB|nr:alkaline phosphatase [Psychromarinibacter sediminicola]MDF0600833.1 alkaline phosphatase [Psychromarinibacter sediminicola]
MKTLAISAFALAAATAASGQTVVQTDNDWYVAGQDRLQAEIERMMNTGQAKNVIILISDGNGVGTNYASRVFAGQQDGGFGDEYVQHHETFPELALVKTYNVNAQTPDSAGTGTAMMSGVKTKAGIIGVTADVDRGDCSTLPGNTVTSMNQIADEMGKATGIVSTARITHATPASAYAKTVDRNYEASVPEGCDTQTDIATQLIEAMEAGWIDVALGGGRRNFIGEDITGDEGGNGRRAAGENLIEDATGMGIAYAWNDETFAELPKDGTPLLGLFEDSHMMYEADRTGEPSLAEMTATAIEALTASGGDNGFFLQVEAGRVDHANHGGNLARVVRDQKAFAEAVAMADEMTDDADTLIIVTADHEHAIAFNGYCGRGSDILGLCMGIDGAGIEHTGEPNTGSDEKPYTVAGYLNGAGSVLREDKDWTGTRSAMTEDEATDIDYTQEALIPLSSETHSGEDVAVYAKGPWAHLLDGTIEQNVIFHVMLHAMTAEE